MRQPLWPGLAAALTLGIAACGDAGGVSDLSYAEVQRAAAGSDQARFRDWFQDVQGQRVAWNGRVVEVAKEHGDDFVEITMLLVDLDGDSGGTTDADVRLPISASLAEDMYAGREVSFTGRIEDFEWTARRPVLRLDAQRIE
jgi:starvation-inducible outer membrane lipoprotein